MKLKLNTFETALNIYNLSENLTLSFKITLLNELIAAVNFSLTWSPKNREDVKFTPEYL